MLGSCDGGASCAYTNTIAWRNPTTPLPIENTVGSPSIAHSIATRRYPREMAGRVLKKLQIDGVLHARGKTVILFGTR